MLQFSRILVPVDFSDSSDEALRYARALAERVGGQLHLLHVLDESIIYGGLDPLPISVRTEFEQRAAANLARLATDISPVPELVTRVGSPFLEIIRYARDAKIELIVIGTHGHGPIAHLLLGSVAERVVRKAPCPVLTVRPSQHEFVMP